MKIPRKEVESKSISWRAWCEHWSYNKKLDRINKRMMRLAHGDKLPTRWKQIRKWKTYELKSRKMAERLCKIEY
jgi:hypothetical protein